MIRQSHPPAILLTRPSEQSQRFATELAAMAGRLAVTMSPLMVAEYLTPPVPDRRFSAVIFASETGVAAALRHPDRLRLPREAWCIGARTAAAARAGGFQALAPAADAAALMARIKVERPMGPLLFLRGADSTGAMAESLVQAGTETVSVVIYRQAAQLLSAEAVALIHGSGPVIVPLFSPRSARLFAAEVARVGAVAPLEVVALSPAVAQAAAPIHPRQLVIAAQPDGASMLAALVALIGAGPMA